MVRAVFRAMMGCVLAFVIVWPTSTSADSSDDMLLLIMPSVVGRCIFALDKTSLTFNASGGEQSVAVTASRSTCAWVTQTPSEASSWLTVIPSGMGSGSATVTAAANTDTTDRSVIIQVAGKTVSISQAAETSTFTLPDTGQTKCFNHTEEITCPSPGQRYYGQDANYSERQPSYRNNGDGTITDLVTGLVWQQADIEVAGFWKGRNWYEAVTYCKELSLGGQKGWRLPSRMELLSIVDAGRDSPTINPVFTCSSSDPAGGYWSSTGYVGGLEYAWYVNFDFGYSNYTTKGYLAHVRCVRGGP